MKRPEGKYWTAFYVKSRAEKKTADRLTLAGFEVYCPVVEEMRQWSDRKKKVKVPLFSSYVFAKVNEQIRLEILQDVGIVSSVMWMKKPAVIRQEELEAIRLFLGESSDIEVGMFKNYEPGELVEIKSGPFAGNRAIMIDNRKNKAVVRIEGVQIELSVSIHKSIL